MTHLGCGAYVVGISDGRRAVYWFGCRKERHGIGLGESEVSTRVSLLLAPEEGGKMPSD